MNNWQASDEEDRETVKSRYEPIIKFSYTNSDKTVTSNSDKKWIRKTYAVSGLDDYTPENNGSYVGSTTESFYSASEPNYYDTTEQNGDTYTETHFNGSYDFQDAADHGRGDSPNMDGSFRGMFCPQANDNTSASNVKGILFRQCTYEERQDEINRLLRNNAKNEKFIQVNNNANLGESNSIPMLSYRDDANTIESGNNSVPATVKFQQLSEPTVLRNTSLTRMISTDSAQENRSSTDSSVFESEFFPKMTKEAVEKVKKVSMEMQSGQIVDSRSASPIDFLSRRAIFEPNNTLANVYKNNGYRFLKTSKTSPKEPSNVEEKEGNYLMMKITTPFKSCQFPEIGTNKLKSLFGMSQKSTSSHQTGLDSKSSQSNAHVGQSTTVSSNTITKTNSQCQQPTFSDRPTKKSAPSYLKDFRERIQKTSTNLSRYGTSVQEEKLLRQSACVNQPASFNLRQSVNARKSDKIFGNPSPVQDEDKSSDYESLSTSMETVIDCTNSQLPERCSSVDTSMHKVGKYNKRVADIVRLFDEMEVKHSIPDGYYTWQEYKLRRNRGLSRWGDPSSNSLSKSYSNISELQRTDSPVIRSDLNISNLSSSFETSASLDRLRPQSVDVCESRNDSRYLEGSRNDSRYLEGSRNESRYQEGSRNESMYMEESRNESKYQEESYHVTTTRDSSPYLGTRQKLDGVSSQEKTVVTNGYYGSFFAKPYVNHTNSEVETQKQQNVNNSLFHDERRSAFERHTPVRPMPEPHYENVLYSSADLSKNSYEIEGTESSFINTGRMSNLDRLAEPTVTKQLIEKEPKYYVASTVTQSRLIPMIGSAKCDDKNGRSRASTRTESRSVERKEKSLTRKPRAVTWDLNENHGPSRFRSHSADPYEMTRKSAMRSVASGGSSMNLSTWRTSSPDPSPHFLNLTADAKRKAESYNVNSDQKLLNILFDNLMENKYLNRTSKLKQNQEVIEQSKFIQDRDKEISQRKSASHGSLTEVTKSMSGSEINLSAMNRVYSSPVGVMKSVSRPFYASTSEMTTNTLNGRTLSSDGQINKVRTMTDDGEETRRLYKSCTAINNQSVTSHGKPSSNSRHLPTATYGASFMRPECDSPRSFGQKRNCRLVSSPVNVGNATVRHQHGQSRAIQNDTKSSTIRSYTSGTTIQSSKKLQFDSTCQSTDSTSPYPWSNKRETPRSPAFSPKKDIIGNASYSSKRDMIGSPSHRSRSIMTPSYDAKREVIGSSSHFAKRELIWSPPCTSPHVPFRGSSPASSIAFDERAFSPRITSPFRVISPGQGNSVINMQTMSRSESALSARNTPLSESAVLRSITANTDGMSDIEYRKQMYLKSLEVDGTPPMKYQADAVPDGPVSRTTAY